MAPFQENILLIGSGILYIRKFKLVHFYVYILTYKHLPGKCWLIFTKMAPFQVNILLIGLGILHLNLFTFTCIF